MLNSIKQVIKNYNEHQVAGYEELFGENAEEVMFTTRAIQVTSTIQFFYDWRNKGFKKAMVNNTTIAGGLVAYYVVRIPAVEKAITDKIELFVNR